MSYEDFTPPDCPRCGSPIRWTIQDSIDTQYQWRCGYWMNGAGDVPSFRCWLRSLMPWNIGKAIFIRNP